MKILFLENHDKFINGLPYGFVKAGHEVLVSGDITQSKLNYIFEIFKPDLVFVIGWAFEHSDDKVNIISEMLDNLKLPLIYWATEDSAYYNYLSLPLVRKLKASFVFTISNTCVNNYEKEGFPAALLNFAYSSLLNNTITKDIKYDISLVANAYPNVFKWKANNSRLESLNILLYPLIANRIKVDIWGNDWDCVDRHIKMDIPKEWTHGYISYLKISSIFSSSKINLGVQNYTKDAITMRTFEILGSGGFLVTSPNEKIYELFDDNKDLITSHDTEETLALVGYYMRHENEINKIKQRAMHKIMSQHTYKHRAEYAMEVLKKEGII